MLFRTRDLLVRQRTQLINALRGHLAEYGVVAARGPAHLKRLSDAIADGASCLPGSVRDMGQLYLEQIAVLDAKVKELDKRLRAAAAGSETARRPAEHAGNRSGDRHRHRDLTAGSSANGSCPMSR
jgi:transposase